MPSHPDRVRRNYHEVESRSTEDTPQGIVYINVTLTKLEMASWMSPYLAAQAMAQRVFREVLKVMEK